MSVACVVCRKKLDIEKDHVRIDPHKQQQQAAAREEKRARAKGVVEGLAQKLEESQGQLDAETWEQLYHAIDVPDPQNARRDIRVSALPSDFLAHLRSATGLPTISAPGIPQPVNR